MSTAYTRQVSPLRRLLTYVLRYRRAFAVGLVCSCVTTAIALVSPVVLQRAVSVFQRHAGDGMQLGIDAEDMGFRTEDFLCHCGLL